MARFRCQIRNGLRGYFMRWALAAIVLASLILMSGCIHVPLFWPLKVEAAAGEADAI
jgi:hypothetical protein